MKQPGEDSEASLSSTPFLGVTKSHRKSKNVFEKKPTKIDENINSLVAFFFLGGSFSFFFSFED